MGLFVFMSADALDQRFFSAANAANNNQSNLYDRDKAPIRRPYRGIQIKDDTYSTLSIIDGSGTAIPLLSESSKSSPQNGGTIGQVNTYADFIIQQIQEQRVEKQQIIETFGDPFVFFFGERPRMITFSGTLVNTEDFNWRSQFMYNYDNYLRGTKLVQRNARAFLTYDRIVVEGYPININANIASEDPYLVPFQMTMFVTNQHDFSEIGQRKFPNSVTPLDLDAANAQLTDARNQFIPTGLAVRQANLESGRSQSFFSALREAGQAVNSVLSTVNAAKSLIEATLFGRVIRVPTGVAGFLDQVGQIGIAVAGTTSSGFNIGLVQNRVKVPPVAMFTPVSSAMLRGFKSDNYDEYPIADQENAAFARLSPLDILNRTNALVDRNVKIKKQQLELLAANAAASTQSDILEVAAGVTNLARTGFSLYATVKATATDPKAVLLDTLGLSGLGGSAPTARQKQIQAASQPIPSQFTGPPSVPNPARFGTSQVPGQG